MARFRASLLIASALIALPATLRAADDEGAGGIANALALDAPEWQWGDLEFRAGGFAAGALFHSQEDAGPARPNGFRETGVSGEAEGNLRVQRIFDNGMIVGARGQFLLYHDELSGDVYGNDFVQQIYGFLQTGFGRLQIGQADGAGYQLALTGPEVAPQVSLEGGGISLFRNPVTGEEFAPFFQHVTAVQTSSNYAKIVYTSPRLFGAQIAASYTPHIVRAPFPFAGNPKDVADGQNGIWEIAANYSDYIGNLAVGVSAAFAHGSLVNRTPGFADLDDWALGAQFSYMISDVKLSWGGAYRRTNAFLLEPTLAMRHGGSHLVRLSAMAEKGSWLLGGEYNFADMDSATNITVAGYQAALGYKINDNLQVTAGWQWQDYHRNAGAFYNGARIVGMDAGFLTLGYSL